MVMSMGFEADMARTALTHTDNNVERAIEWIFSHPEGAPPAQEEESSSSANSSSAAAADPTQGLTNGEPRFVLISCLKRRFYFTLCLFCSHKVDLCLK